MPMAALVCTGKPGASVPSGRMACTLPSDVGMMVSSLPLPSMSAIVGDASPEASRLSGKPGSSVSSWRRWKARLSSPMAYAWVVSPPAKTRTRTVTSYCSMLSRVVGSMLYWPPQNDAGIAATLMVPDTAAGALPLPLANVVQPVLSLGCGPSPYCSSHV